MRRGKFVHNDCFGHFRQILPQSQAGNATLTGTAFDSQGSANLPDYQEAVLLASLGDLTSNGTISVVFTVEDSADNVNFSQVTLGALIEAPSVTLTAENTQGRLAFRLSSLRQYVRAKAVLTFTGGTTPAQFIAADFILLNPHWDPA